MNRSDAKVTTAQFIVLWFLESQYFPAGWPFGLFAGAYILCDDPECATGAGDRVHSSPENKKWKKKNKQIQTNCVCVFAPSKKKKRQKVKSGLSE